MRAAAILALLLAVSLTACQTPPEKYAWLKQIDLKPVVKAGFHDYKKLSYPAYFAVTEDGRVYGYSFCDAAGCRGNAMMVAIYSCERYSKGAPCKIYAKGASPVFPRSSDKSNESPMNKATKWAGVISGGGCSSFSIEMTIDKDGGIVGEATHHATGTMWDVSGMVDKSNFVNIRIEDIGDVARSQAVGKLPWLTLAGHLTGSSLSIAQPSSRSCDPPRNGVLKRL